ncbi:hypothetical protein M2459_000022 [Parabacteroides sp. PF5-5]|uniref:fimbrillin family protein n=1 Tax=unclassified Parabacteroides TaxID=2649774 RepID=UPI0024764C43|nr:MULTISPECIES: fimbrillin family protein [unclassified Parabacteroides]MDH6303690.1 hypothetical protein [Parabacteroides sp. PH5-39]MDH6314307.1 hypothetical protein [Parabacteroides sp. PF5-13]MDH6318629.1 hypothetical protein [Parabacteroides sp. PH5-13]MDH6322079.1 hypothetical protein [Parabacteroides sp. PH5-8]MDH6325842.1 hypothetical protein [Parabacteroides sp. PH5-41]
MRQKIILGVSLLAIAGMWTGCSNEEDATTFSTPKDAISFRTQGGMPESRATETTKDHVDAFVVYGADTDASNNTTTLFDGVTVARQAGTDNFAYSPIKYYSEGATTADFVAYSPVSKKITNPVTAFTGTVSFDYEVDVPVATGKTSQEDLLIAGTHVDPVSATVSLGFKHALSRIFVKATNALSETVVIKGLTLKNLKSTGKISSSSTAWTWAWSDQNDPIDYVYVLAPTGVAVQPVVAPSTPTPTLVTSMEQGMMVLPQKTVNPSNDQTFDTGDFALEVEYDVANLTSQKAYVLLPDEYEFKMGNQYAITVAFNPTSIPNLIEITFNITVAAFENDPDGTYPVTP